MEDVSIQKIGNYIKIFVITVLSILLIYNVYDNSRSKEQLKESKKTADSLEALINKYEFDYTTLKKRADELDSLIKVRKDSILIVKQKFYIYRDKEIKNPDEATKYIINFLKD
jgi:competence protein ComGC